MQAVAKDAAAEEQARVEDQQARWRAAGTPAARAALRPRQAGEEVAQPRCRLKP